MAYTRDGNSLGTVGRLIAAAATDISPIPKAVMLLTAGTVTIVPDGNASNTALTMGPLPAGYIIPYRVRRVTALSGGATVATIEDL